MSGHIVLILDFPDDRVLDDERGISLHLLITASRGTILDANPRNDCFICSGVHGETGDSGCGICWRSQEIGIYVA